MKVSPEERAELIQLYLDGRTKKLSRRQKELGVEKSYAQKRASDMGLTKLPPEVSRRDFRDRRWQRAIERGAVIA